MPGFNAIVGSSQPRELSGANSILGREVNSRAEEMPEAQAIFLRALRTNIHYAHKHLLTA
jgi:hypothetical protein